MFNGARRYGWNFPADCDDSYRKGLPERVIAEDTNRLLSVDAGYLSKGNKVGASSLVTIADKCAEEAKQL